MQLMIKGKDKDMLAAKIECMRLTTQKAKVESTAVELELKAQLLEKCLTAKDEEIGSLRRIKENLKLEMRNLAENTKCELAAKDLELEELSLKKVDIKKLNNTINKQKIEINRLRMSNEQSLRRKVELEKETDNLRTKLKQEADFGRILVLREKARPAVPPSSSQDEKLCSIPSFAMPSKQQGKQVWFEKRGKKTNNAQKIKSTSKSSTQGGRKGNKTRVIMVGDECVRNTGPLLQSDKTVSQVSVRGGTTIRQIKSMLQEDAARVQGGFMIVGTGNEEVRNEDSEQMKVRMEELIISMERLDIPGVAVLPLLPQKSSVIQGRVKAVNTYLRERCSASKVILLDTNLNVWDTSKNGLELNHRGRSKVTSIILDVIAPATAVLPIRSVAAPTPAIIFTGVAAAASVAPTPSGPAKVPNPGAKGSLSGTIQAPAPVTLSTLSISAPTPANISGGVTAAASPAPTSSGSAKVQDCGAKGRNTCGTLKAPICNKGKVVPAQAEMNNPGVVTPVSVISCISAPTPAPTAHVNFKPEGQMI